MPAYKDPKTGKWYANFSRYVDGKRRYHKKRGFDTKRDALRYEAEQRLISSDAPSSTTTLESVYDAFMASKINLAPKSISKYTRYFEGFLAPISRYKLSRLSQLKLNQIATAIRASHYSVAYKNGALTFLRSLLKFSNNYFNTNFKPDLVQRAVKKTTDVTERATWTDEEFYLFISKVDNPVYKAFFTTLYKTGARKGELKACLVEQLKGNRLYLTHTLRTSQEGRVAMKTLSSRRNILLDDLTLALIRSQLHGEWLFGGIAPLSDSSIDRVFRKAIKSSNVKPIRIHDLRHSHATNLINAGANILAVSRRLGHSSTNMTLKVYAHLLDKTEEDLIKFL